MPERYRTGRKLGRTIYRQTGDEADYCDEFLGIMDTPELGALVVAALNRGDPDERLRADLDRLLSAGGAVDPLDVACAIEWFDEHGHPLSAAAVRGLVARVAELEASRQVGICGASTPAVFENVAPLLCTLPAGHAGWHHTTDGADFTEGAQPDDPEQIRARLRDTADQAVQAEMARLVAERDEARAALAKALGTALVEELRQRFVDRALAAEAERDAAVRAYETCEHIPAAEHTEVLAERDRLNRELTEISLLAGKRADQLVLQGEALDKATAERDRLADTLHRYQPVIDAAKAWLERYADDDGRYETTLMKAVAALGAAREVSA